MEKVLFVEIRNGEKPKFSFDEIMDPIGLCYVASAVRQAGYEVKLIQQVNSSDDVLLNEIGKFSPDLVGFTAVTANYNRTVQVAKLVKDNMDVVTVIGGIHATTDMRNVADNFDYVIIGEGEESIVELLYSIEHGDVNSVRGIAFKDEQGRFIFTGRRERIQNPDAIPFPLRDGLEMDKFTPIPPYPSSMDNFASLLSSRACKFNCPYCANEAMWRGTGKGPIPVTTRLPENVVDEMEFLKDMYDVNYVWFHDPNFTYRAENRIEDFCRELLKRHLNIKWSVMGRVDDILRGRDLGTEEIRRAEDLLNLMRSAGCHILSYGVESGEERILKNMRRGITLDKTQKVIELTFNAGIIPVVFFVVGVPAETEDSLNTTKEYASQIEAIRYRFAYFYPFIGTRYRLQVDEEQLWLSEEHKSFDLATTEVQTVKCGVEPSCLKNYMDRIENDIYKSEVYKHRLEEFISKHPEQRDTISQWKAALASL